MALPNPSDNAPLQDEWRVLVECASPACDPRRLLDLMSTVNWPRLCVLAEEHGVLGHLAGRLDELDKNVVPQEIGETLLEQHRAQVFSTLRLSEPASIDFFFSVNWPEG